MDDLTIMKYCADAMGLKTVKGGSDEQFMYGEKGIVTTYCLYNPLNDDAQCFALVKKFEISIGRNQGVEWDVENRHSSFADDYVCVMNKDLNRAICKCVARMQQAKG